MRGLGIFRAEYIRLRSRRGSLCRDQRHVRANYNLDYPRRPANPGRPIRRRGPKPAIVQNRLDWGPIVVFGIVRVMRAKGPRDMSVRSTVIAQFEQVAAEQKRKLGRLTDDLVLLDSGLDSLGFALVVVRLEEALGFDPFDVADDIKFPSTFADFVKLYEGHPAKSGA
jgi:acyl carrier protein